jgi:hypothetical protein
MSTLIHTQSLALEKALFINVCLYLSMLSSLLNNQIHLVFPLIILAKNKNFYKNVTEIVNPSVSCHKQPHKIKYLSSSSSSLADLKESFVVGILAHSFPPSM